MTDYKRFDTHDTFTIHNARLAKDPAIIEGGEKPLVKLTFVSTTRSERYEDLWIEAAVRDGQADLATHLKKGDTIGITGKPAFRRWGDDNAKVSFELLRAELFPPIELFQTLKERGFTPGGGSKKPATKGAKPARKIVNLDDE